MRTKEKLFNRTEYRNENGFLDSENDLPAVIYDEKHRLWYKNGLKHRDLKKPAEIWSCGKEFWYINGRSMIWVKYKETWVLVDRSYYFQSKDKKEFLKSANLI
jgi:hypothetical protein